MKAMRKLSLVLAGLLLGSLACEGPAPVPAKPTWVDDVEPILRANCFHCHGSLNPDPMSPLLQRWDFYDLKDPRLMAIRDVATDYMKAWDSAKDHAGPSFPTYINAAPNSPIRMPPPPATPLSADAKQTILAWIATGSPPGATVVVPPLRGVRLNNKPTAAWLVRPSTIVMSDGDHEQVLGKVTCGGADEPVLHSGTTTLPTGWQPPCTATLFDGQDVVTVNLQ
jgi:hypothetical protein